MNDDEVMVMLRRVADAVHRSLAGLSDWGLADTLPGQHTSDLIADAAALEVLDEAGVGVLSEESGLRRADESLIVVVDPLDGSTNAAHGVPWYATSLCAVDGDGPRAALVVDQVSGTSFHAVRDQGAFRDGEPIEPSGCRVVGDALVGLSGFPTAWLGWRQYRALGAAALDISLVASGSLDAYLDCSRDAHGCWDYLAAMLICVEAGACIEDAFGRELLVLEHGARRTPVAASTPELLAELLRRRRAVDDGRPGG